jgi:hypothetical protein
VADLGELGPDGQVYGVVAALVLVQLGARRDEPKGGGSGPTRRPEADLALACQPGVLVDGVVTCGGRGVPEVSQRACHLGCLASLAAGVEYADFGVGELGRGDVGHGRRRHLLTECRLRGIGRGRGRIACRGLLHVGGLVEREHPDHQGYDGKRYDSDDGRENVASAERSAVFVERRAGGDLGYHPCTVRAGPTGGPYLDSSSVI